MSTSPKHDQDFVLLGDFQPAYDLLTLRKSVMDEDAISQLSSDMRQSLADHVRQLYIYDIPKIRAIIDEHLDERYYVVTLDGATYFKKHDLYCFYS